MSDSEYPSQRVGMRLQSVRDYYDLAFLLESCAMHWLGDYRATLARMNVTICI
jgi:hypothetical protein